VWLVRLNSSPRSPVPTKCPSRLPCGGGHPRQRPPPGGGTARFAGGRIYTPADSAVGTAAVHGAILARYLAKGGPAGSGLGFPTAGENRRRWSGLNLHPRQHLLVRHHRADDGEALLDHR